MRLPGRLGDAWQFTAVSHFTEANTRDTEFLQGTAWTSVDGVTVANTYWRGVAWHLLQANACFFALFIGCVRVDQLCFQLFTTFIVTSNDFFTFLVFRDHRFLSQCLALLSKINVFAGYWIVFLQSNTVWVVATVLTGDVSVASASG